MILVIDQCCPYDRAHLHLYAVSHTKFLPFSSRSSLLPGLHLHLYAAGGVSKRSHLYIKHTWVSLSPNSTPLLYQLPYSHTFDNNTDSSTTMLIYTIALASFGFTALVLSAPTDTSRPTANPATAWEDTQTQKYHCEGKDVVRCETTVGGTCFAIDLCEVYCFDHDNGASCVDLNVPNDMTTSDDIDVTIPKAPASGSGTNVLPRDASAQKDEHLTCSRDRASILICRYGFCSSEKYCKSGDECKDECNCCKSKSPSAQGARSEVRPEPIRVEDAAVAIAARETSPQENKHYVCSKDRTSVLKCTYGFCATDYYCATRHPCIDNPARCKRARHALD